MYFYKTKTKIMKRLNYYEAHKNKKPKVKKQKKYLSLLSINLALNNILTFNKINIIRSQQIEVKEKKLMILKETMYNFNAVNRILIQERQRKFKLTGRYT